MVTPKALPRWLPDGAAAHPFVIQDKTGRSRRPLP
jgi:hypothetical protein